MQTLSASIADRPIRSLVRLEENGATARTLNLLSVWRRHAEDPEYLDRPFFKSPILNKSLIVKHRLRENERHIFADGRAGATKVILPIDVTDLRSGARSFFVGERGYLELLKESFNASETIEPHDIDLLELLDTLPSLDPFLLRERLQKGGFYPARCYFELTEADLTRMFQFARKEVSSLVGMSFDDATAVSITRADRLATKILSNASDAELEPLRLGLAMSQTAFAEGVFCWKGFIYYKWSLMDLLPQVSAVLIDLSSVKLTEKCSFEQKTQIHTARTRLKKSITTATETVRSTLKVYDDAYYELTNNGKPTAFREFLLGAPEMFYELGERLGAIQHIVSFWRFRFPQSNQLKIGAEAFVDLLVDFELSFSFAAAEREA
jgi:hypothetical protein